MNTPDRIASSVASKAHVDTGVLLNAGALGAERSPISVVSHPDKGLILTTAKPVAQGALLSSAILYPIPRSDLELMVRTDFHKFVFFRPGDATMGNRQGYVAFGPVSLCSHSDRPNALVSWIENDHAAVLELRALAAIPRGVEVTMRYSNIQDYPGHELWT